MTFINKFIRYCQWSIFIQLYERNVFILITECSDKEFEDVKRRKFSSGWKYKEVRISRTYIHKSRSKSTDTFNIKKLTIYLKHETRGNLYTSMVGTFGILIALDKGKIRKGYFNPGIFVGMPFVSHFLAIIFILVIETWPKCWRISW